MSGAPPSRPGRATAQVEVVAIGDELVHGHSVDTNSAEIARTMAECGFAIGRGTVVGDDPGHLSAALVDAASRGDVVVATGGLGPTEDDRTRDVVAALLGVGLAFDAPSWEAVLELWRSRVPNRPIPESNRRQAMFPEGVEILPNPIGTAPGFRADMPSGAQLFVLPGVPREMRRMLEFEVLPRVLGGREGLRPVALHTLAVLGPSEAELGELLQTEMQPGRDPAVGVTAKDGLLIVRILARGPDLDAARGAAAAEANRLAPRLGGWLVGGGPGDDGVRLEGLVAARLLRDVADPVTCATAESCTGGLVAGALTDVPGISAAFLGGAVTYSNAAKVRDLGVPAGLIERYGAVSEPVAEAMARGVCGRTGARLGVAITGVAGPGGGSPGKPVGAVCFATCADGVLRTWRRDFPDLGRSWIRQRAAGEALVGLLRACPG